MLAQIKNDFGALALDLETMKAATVSPMDFYTVNSAAYAINESFDSSKLCGQSVNLCEFNNARAYWNLHGGFIVEVRIGAVFHTVATFDSCGDSECDLDAAFTALGLRN